MGRILSSREAATFTSSVLSSSTPSTVNGRMGATSTPPRSVTAPATPARSCCAPVRPVLARPAEAPRGVDDSSVPHVLTSFMLCSLSDSSLSYFVQLVLGTVVHVFCALRCCAATLLESVEERLPFRPSISDLRVASSGQVSLCHRHAYTHADARTCTHACMHAYERIHVPYELRRSMPNMRRLE